jgi:hypothetical protein
VLCIHAATAYGDAIAILAAGKKWDINQRATDTDHQIGSARIREPKDTGVHRDLRS